MSELTFAYSDLYPAWGGIDTSNKAVPESDDLDALGENSKQAEEAANESSSKSIFLALGIMIALIVFFGGK